MLRRAPRAAARASPRRPAARRLSSAAAQTYDVVIVGAGVIGASCSLQLARKGFRTLNVDKGPAAGSGSTSYSSGNLRSMYTALTSTMFADEGYHFWQDWQGQLGLSADGDGHGLAAYRPTGGGIMHTDASSAFLEGCYANHDQLGIPYERWDVAELTRRIPVFDPTAYYPPRRIDDPDFGTPSTEHSFYGAGYFPQAGYVSDPMLAAINVMTAAKEAGASYRFNSAVASIDKSGGRVSGVTLEDGERISAPIVLNVGGPHSAQLTEMAFRDSGVENDMNVHTRAMRTEVAWVNTM